MPRSKSGRPRSPKVSQPLRRVTRGSPRREAEAEQIVADARKQATGILDQANARANEIVAEGKENGVKERDRQIAAAQAEIEQETNKAREELRGQVSAIAVASAEKILNREIDAKQHEDILGKLASEL